MRERPRAREEGEYMKKLLVFGTGDFADVVSFVLEAKLKRRIDAYAVHGRYRGGDTYRGRRLAALENMTEEFPPCEYEVALAVIGKRMFDQREAAFTQLRELGYELVSVIDPSAQVDTKDIGAGNIILANAAIEAHCRVGEGNIIWQNVVLPHHNEIGSFNNLAPSVSLSGYSKVGNHCFLGNNVCVKNRLEIADYAYIGAGSYVSRPVEAGTVLVPHRSYVLEGKSGFDFL